MSRKIVGILMLVSVLILSLSGCMLTGTTVNVNGTWHVVAVYTAPGVSSTTILDTDMDFQQNGNTLTVDYIFQGTVNGNKVTFSFSNNGASWSFTGTVSGNKMSGTWTMSDGTNTISGTWTAVKK